MDPAFGPGPPGFPFPGPIDQFFDFFDDEFDDDDDDDDDDDLGPIPSADRDTAWASQEEIENQTVTGHERSLSRTGVTPDAGENEIRQRYLELVRGFRPTGLRSVLPPFTRPTRPCATPANRLREQLFGLEPKNSSFESISADLHARLRDLRLPVDMLLSWADSP